MIVNSTVVKSYERLACEIKSQMDALKEKEKARNGIANILTGRLKLIRETISDLAQNIEVKDVSETLNSSSEEIQKLIMGIAMLGEQVDKTKDQCNRFWENFVVWRNENDQQ